MASDQEYLDFVLEQLSEAEGITSRAMMGEYILYCRGKVFGGIYDNRFLVKPTAAAKALMPEAALETPYPGGKEMLLVEDMENKAFLAKLVAAMYKDLPAPKAKKKG
ncbi:MAG: TfoX/Sxy family protein [Clostridia bacterium]|nr:TfoX/Sxy family protein [Clostridia bacterium]